MLPPVTAAIGIPATLVPHYHKITRGEIEQITTYNVCSIVSLALAFAFAPAGVVLAHIALSQIKRTNERGWGLAASALWIGYWNVLYGLVIVVGWIVGLTTWLNPVTSTVH